MSLRHGKKGKNHSQCPLNRNRARCFSPMIMETSPDVATAGDQLTAENFPRDFSPAEAPHTQCQIEHNAAARRHRSSLRKRAGSSGLTGP